MEPLFYVAKSFDVVRKTQISFDHPLSLIFFLARICEKGPCRASFQNRIITAIGKSRL